jgi:hypothetical protein
LSSRIGTRACEVTEWKKAYPIRTLATACAEAGNFDAAVKWQTRANGLLAEAGDKSKGQERLTLYQEKKPFWETTL